MEHFPQNGKYVRSQIHSRRGKNWGQVEGKEDVSVLYGNRYIFSKKKKIGPLKIVLKNAILATVTFFLSIWKQNGQHWGLPLCYILSELVIWKKLKKFFAVVILEMSRFSKRGS